MPRKNLIRSNVLPYHVTGRVNNREMFYAGIEDAWKELTQQCYEITILFGVRIHAFVLMPNHFHLLITVPEHDLVIVMQHFMRAATKEMNRRSGRSGRVFG